jgi:type I restriction enzyme S subunit
MTHAQQNWAATPLIELLSTLETGGRPKGGVRDIADGIPSLGGEHLSYGGKFKFEKLKFIPEEFANSLKSGKLSVDDVLVVKDGATTGKTVRVGKDFPFETAYVNEHVYLCRPWRNINSQYITYFLRSDEGQKAILDNFRGAAQGGITKAFAENVLVPVAPLNEQIRIANKLDSLLAKVDAAQTRLEKIPALLKRFRQSVLAAATSGELTREWRENERGEKIIDLVAQISKARVTKWEQECRRTGRKKKYKAPETSNLDALPSIPSNWVWASVDSVSSKVVDGVHKKPDYQLTGIPFITVRNLTAGPGISFENLNYISEDDHQEFYQRANPEKGDILISKDGTLGVVRQIKTDDVFSIFVSVALVKPVLQEISNYLEIAFSAPVVQNQMVGVGTGLQHIHLTDLKKDMIPLPPLTEQNEIVRRVESLFALADVVEKQYLAAKQRLDRLSQSLLAKAFRGELVPQDPNDEPAAELLKRIQVERQQQAAEKPKRKAGARDSQNIIPPKQIKTNTNTMQLKDAPENYLLELLAQLGGETHAEVLWKKSELAIDDFYAKLKQEMQANGIVEDKHSPDPALRKLKVANQ